MIVHLVWHIHHFEKEPGAAHFDPEALDFDEETDDAQLIGVYSTRDGADAAVERTRLLEGFRDEPDCFMIDAHTLDEDGWTDGYVTVDVDERADGGKSGETDVAPGAPPTSSMVSPLYRPQGLG
jgi:hypothetical protein